MSPKKAKGLKFKEAKHLIANFQQSKTSRCVAVKNICLACPSDVAPIFLKVING